MTEAKYEKANKFIVNSLARCPDTYGITDLNSKLCLERMNTKMKGNHTFATSWTNKKGAINKGRRFPKTSLAGLARPIRNALAQQFYFDCDMKNASFTTLANIISVNEWEEEYPEIMNYFHNRERLLGMLMKDRKNAKGLSRDDAKKAFISAIFGGDISKYRLTNLTEISQEAKDLYLALISSGNKELVLLNKNILADDEIKKKSKHNIHGQFLAQMTTMFERRALETVLEVITNLGYSYGATMNDGVFIEHKRGRTPEQIVADINKKYLAMTEDSGDPHPVSFHYKEFTEVLDIPKEVLDAKNYGCDPFEIAEYNKIKDEFETTHFKCLYECCYYTITGEKRLIPLSKEQMKLAYENLNDYRGNCMTGSKQETNFLSNWFADPNMRTYDEVVFRPTHKQLPPTQFNSFMGFDIEQLNQRYINENIEFSEKDIIDCEFIEEHIRYLTDNGHETKDECYEYLLNWLAQIFQDPENKPQTAIVLRSVAKGVGKNDFTYLLSRMIGNEYYNQSDNPERDLFGGFNDLFDKKILLNLDEGDKKSTQRFYEELKAKITNDTSNIRKKFKSVNSNVRLYANFIFTTNNDGVHIDVESRRFQLMECVNMKRSREDTHWCDIRKALRECTGGMLLFYRMLMARDVRHYDFSKPIQTPFLLRAKRNCLPAPLSFLKTIFSFDAELKIYKDNYSYIPVNLIFGHYKDWCRANNESYTQAKDFIDELQKIPFNIVYCKDQVCNQYLKTKKRTLFINLIHWRDYLLSKNLIELEDTEAQQTEASGMLSDSEDDEL